MEMSRLLTPWHGGPGVSATIEKGGRWLEGLAEGGSPEYFIVPRRSKQHVGTRNIYGNKRGDRERARPMWDTPFDGTHRVLFMGAALSRSFCIPGKQLNWDVTAWEGVGFDTCI